MGFRTVQHCKNFDVKTILCFVFGWNVFLGLGFEMCVSIEIHEFSWRTLLFVLSHIKFWYQVLYLKWIHSYSNWFFRYFILRPRVAKWLALRNCLLHNRINFFQRSISPHADKILKPHKYPTYNLTILKLAFAIVNCLFSSGVQKRRAIMLSVSFLVLCLV